MKRLTPLALLLVAGLSGLLLEADREEAGVVPAAARIPLGGFEPLAVDVLYLRADSLLAQRRLPEALAAIRLVTELQPRVSDGWELLAHTLAWQTSESSRDPEEQWRWVTEAIDVLARGILLNPDSVSMRMLLGQIYLDRLAVRDDIRPVAERELGRPPEEAAREVFAGIMEEHDSDPVRAGFAGSTWMLAETLYERGEKEEALELYREALPIFRRFAADPEAPDAAARVKEIEDRIASITGR